jgi:hypothetical protein
MEINCQLRAVPWLRRLAAGFPPRRPEFNPGSARVGFVVEKVALGQVFSCVLRFYTVSFIPSVLHYLEKDKNNYTNHHLHHRVAQEALRLRCFRSVCCEAPSPLKKSCHLHDPAIFPSWNRTPSIH